MAIERYTDSTVILPGEWVIPVVGEDRKAMPPRQVINVQPYGVLLKDQKVYLHKTDIVFVCDTEAEARGVYEIIEAYRERRERELHSLNLRIDLDMQHAIDLAIHTAEHKE